ncbi:MAG TPA: hypothetical protein VFV99_21805 [Kofleriaceae bacterium]|nr:hypothetical protein [Kofleriaceae bacterium]
MLRRVGLAVLLWSRLAAADRDHDYTLVDDTIEYVTAADERSVALTTALSSQATGTAGATEGASVATVRAEANVVEIAGTREGYRFALGGEAELRAGIGDVPELAGSLLARGAIEDTPLFDGGPHFGFGATTVEVQRDYDALPALRDAREWLRAPFDRSRYAVDFTLGRTRDEGSDWTGDTLQLSFASERSRQQNGDIAYTRQVIDLEMMVIRACYGPDSDLFCLRIIEGGGTFPTGASLTTSYFYPVGVDGVPLGDHLRADARLGVLFGNYEIPNTSLGLPDHAPSPTDTCETLGTCVLMRTVGYDLTVRDLDTPHQLHVTRRAYKPMGGEIAIEDRAALATSWQLGKTKLDASAYVAHTRWWTIVDDQFSPQHRGVTYGADVGVSRSLGKRWRVDSTLSAGRSWYGALDGAEPRAGFAAQGTVALAHALRSHWASLQRLRPRQINYY